MIIKYSRTNFKTLSNAIKYGQDFSTFEVICEATDTPDFPFEELYQDYAEFKQGCVRPGLVGEKTAVSELRELLSRIQLLGAGIKS